MNINRDNYESYFTDYLDGQLSQKEIKEMRIFLLLNDDLAELLEDTDQMKLKYIHLKYHNKESLKKDILHGCPDYYAIAAAEECLTEEDIRFTAKHIDYLESEPIYRKLKLNPDSSIHYQNKKRLYRKDHRIVFLRSAVAAVMLLLGGSSYLYLKHHTYPALTLAETSMIIPAIPHIEHIDILSINEINSTITSNNKSITKVSTTTPHSITSEKESLAVMEAIYQAPNRIPQSDNDYSLVSSPQMKVTVNQPEIYLAEAASNWKSSENHILSDNIITSMINAGKMIAEKIRNKEFYE